MRSAEDEDEYGDPVLSLWPLDGSCVLIIDDAPEVRLMLRAALEKDGRFTAIAEAQDGQEGIRVASEVLPAAIVVDQEMPAMNGLEALPLLREVCPSARILMFSSGGEKMREAATAAGADAYCVKGTPLSQLIEALASTP